MKRLSPTTGFLAAVAVLLSACSSTTGGLAGNGGAPGSGGQGGHATATGGSGSDGSSGLGGHPTVTGGNATGGASGGGSGLGGQTTARGGSSGGTGGVPGQGGATIQPDAATGTGGAGGQGGGTSEPQPDALDLARAETGDGPGPEGGTDTGKDVAADAGGVGNPRRVLLCDEGNRRVLLIDLQSPASAVWSTAISDPTKYGDGLRDLQLVGGNRVAVSTAKGYVELDLETGAIKKELSKLTGVESLRRLPNGNTVLGGNSDGGVTLQELDAQDAAVPGHKVTFTNQTQFRMLRRTPQGTFLIGVGTKLAEVNWDKQTLWEMTIPQGDYVYQGLRLPDQTLAVSSGYGAAILILDPVAKKVLTTIGGKAQPDAATIAPSFYGGYQVLPNGHFVVTNWQGHGGGNGGKGIQLLEYDRAGLLVWQWKQDPKLVSSLHHVIVLDGLDTSKLHDDVGGVLAPVTQ